MRVIRVDIVQIQAFAGQEIARPRTGDEWRRALLDVGLMVDLGEAGGEPVRGVQQALATLLRAEEALVAVDQPAPWSVGGVPPVAWALVVGTWVVLTGVWNVLVGFFGGAVFLGGVAIAGLVRHRRETARIAGQVRAARLDVAVAEEAVRARVLALDRGQFPVVTATVRVGVKEGSRSGWGVSGTKCSRSG